MAKDLGKVCMVSMGAYNSEAQYEVLDLVTHEGCLWCAKKGTKGHAPAEGEYWFVASKGAYALAKEAGYKGSESEYVKATGDVLGHIADKNNPHQVTPKQLGLDDVVHTSVLETIPYDGAVDGAEVAKIRRELNEFATKVSYYETIKTI